MALLPKPNVAKAKRVQIRESIAKEVLDEIEEYCQWLGCEKKGYFFEHAAKYILAEDPDWRAYKDRDIALAQSSPDENCSLL